MFAELLSKGCMLAAHFIRRESRTNRHHAQIERAEGVGQVVRRILNEGDYPLRSDVPACLVVRAPQYQRRDEIMAAGRVGVRADFGNDL